MISHFHYPCFPARSKKRAVDCLVAILGAIALCSGAPSLRGEAPFFSGNSSVRPESVTKESFAALQNRSPFQRSIGLSQSLVVTGIFRIEEDVFATLFDVEERESYLVGEEANSEGWKLVSVNGDPSDLETFTARIKVAESEVVSIRYEKLPAKAFRKSSSSSRTGKGGGGGVGPHGGPDPRVLTRDQMADAKKGALNYREGFHADGYPDKPPPATVAKLSRLTTQQREAINVKMYEYRNRGLGLPERAKIYEKMIDRSLQGGR